VDANRIGTLGEQALIGALLVGVVENLHPDNDLAAFNDLLEVRGVPWDQPPAERGLQGLVAGLEAIRKAVGDRTGGAADQLGVARKGKFARGSGGEGVGLVKRSEEDALET
jgi:hypothetical protein